MKNSYSFTSLNHKFSPLLRTFVLILALTFLTFPLPSSAVDENNPTGKYTEMDEIPYSFPSEPGDLSPDELKTAVLDSDSTWEFLAEDSVVLKHVNRLYEQEPDDYTVIYQNKDGSKTVYIFSCRVKKNGHDLECGEFENVTDKIFTLDKNTLTLNLNNSVTSRITSPETENKLYSCNIGLAQLKIAGEQNTVITDLTDRLRTLADSSEESNLLFDLTSGEINDIPGDGTLMYLTYTYSDIAGVFSLKNSYTNRFLMVYTDLSLHTHSGTRPVQILGQWVFSYVAGSNPYYYVRPLYRQTKFLGYNISGSTAALLLNLGAANSKWTLSLFSDDSATFYPYGNGTYSMDSTPGLTDDYGENCNWILTNHESFVPVSDIEIFADRCIYTRDDITSYASVYPSNATSYELAWYYSDGTELETDNEYYIIDSIGTYGIYCVDIYSGTESEETDITAGAYTDFGIGTNKTYAIRPYYSSSPAYYQNYLTMGNATSGSSNPVSVQTYAHGATAYSARWTDVSQTFTIDRNTGAQSVKMAATLCADQYSAGGNQVPNYTDMTSYNNTSWSGYHMVTQAEVPNYLNRNGSDATGTGSSAAGTDWYIYRIGVWNSEVRKYVIGRTETVNGVSVFKALKHETSYSSTTVSVSTYTPGSSMFEWTINEIGLNTPLIKQTKTYYCGYATLLQIMYGAKTQSYLTDSSILHDQMAVIKDSNHANDAGAMSQASICNNLNGSERFVDGSFDYVHYKYYKTEGQSVLEFHSNVETNTKETFVYLLKESLKTGYGAFFLTSTGGSPYVYTAGNAHYITISGYDSISDSFVIVNPHYLNSIYGIYVVPADDLYNSIDTLFWCEPREQQ